LAPPDISTEVDVDQVMAGQQADDTTQREERAEGDRHFPGLGALRGDQSDTDDAARQQAGEDRRG